MDYEKYFSLVEKGRFQEAVEYKCSQIPSALYKYYSLNDDAELNDSKIKYLSENKIYLADFESQNDLFEGNFLIFDKEKLKEHKWDIEFIERFYRGKINNFRIGSLTNTNEQNMPMWAYYSNNHKGFCVKYTLTKRQKKYIFPVTYETERQSGDAIATTIIQESMNIISNCGRVDDYSPDANVCMQMLFFSMAAKHKSWQHEKEYRIIGTKEYFPCMPIEIFIGYDCDENYEKEIVTIGKKEKDINIYKMTIDRNSKKFELIPKRLV